MQDKSSAKGPPDILKGTFQPVYMIASEFMYLFILYDLYFYLSTNHIACSYKWDSILELGSIVNARIYCIAKVYPTLYHNCGKSLIKNRIK